MAESGGCFCCRCCCGFIFTSGLTALFMWLSLRTNDPICSIQDFYVPVLNKTSNYSTSYTQIYFYLKLDNQNRDKGIYYDALNLTFYYAPNRTFAIGNKTLPAFYQGHNKKAHRKEWAETMVVPWPDAIAAVSENKTAMFGVNLTTAVRFKIMVWKTKRHRLVLGADVKVNEYGAKDEHKGIRLKSGASETGNYRSRLGPVVMVFTFLNLMFSI